MDKSEAHGVLESLTEKQHEALALASRHLTSKQIALRLGVSPVTIDKRIEAVRAKLGAMPRATLLQIYCDWRDDDQTIDGSTILGADAAFSPDDEGLPFSVNFEFQDSLSFDARAPWERVAEGRQSGLSPSDLGVGGKLLFMLIGAVAMLMAAVLSIAFANAVMSIFAG